MLSKELLINFVKIMLRRYHSCRAARDDISPVSYFACLVVLFAKIDEQRKIDNWSTATFKCRFNPRS